MKHPLKITIIDFCIFEDVLYLRKIVKPLNTSQALSKSIEALAESFGIVSESLMQVGVFDHEGDITICYIGISSYAAPQSELPDHYAPVGRTRDRIIAASLATLKGALEASTMSRFFLTPFFTMTELQNVYETVFDRHEDKRNFRKKFLHGGKDKEIVQKTDKIRRQGRMRPANLYKFKGRKREKIDLF